MHVEQIVKIPSHATLDPVISLLRSLRRLTHSRLLARLIPYYDSVFRETQTILATDVCRPSSFVCYRIPLNVRRTFYRLASAVDMFRQCSMFVYNNHSIIEPYSRSYCSWFKSVCLWMFRFCSYISPYKHQIPNYTNRYNDSYGDPLDHSPIICTKNRGQNSRLRWLSIVRLHLLGKSIFRETFLLLSPNRAGT